jgi:hypothetical protein
MEANDRFKHWVYEDDLENTSEQLASTAGVPASSTAEATEISYPSYNYSGWGGDMPCIPPNPVVNVNDYRTSIRPILETHINDEIKCSDRICSFNSPSQCWSVPVAAVRPSARRIPVAVERRMSSPQRSVWDRIPQSTTDVGTSKEYKMCKYKYNKSHSYNGVIKTQTHYNNNPTANLQNRYEYLSLSDILKYVTCGGVLCDSYMDEFTSYVLSELNKSSKVEMYLDKVSRIDGGIYEKEKPLISWGDYALCGKLCLEWVLCNPEKLGRG